MISTDGTTTYAHDATDQLTGADHSYQADEAYAYDAAGNRSGADYDTAAANRLTSDGTFDYTYDDEGNLLTRTRISADPADDKIVEYQWDHRNRLIGVVNKDSAGLVTQQVQYTYDVFNNRIIKSVDADGPGPEQAASTHFIYDGEDIVAEFEKAGQSYDLTHRYLHGPGTDQILADEYIDDPTHGVYWALADHQGSVRDVVELDGSTAVIGNHIKYDSFGNIASQSAPGAEFRYSYTGREFDAETGLYYYRARYYDAATARFIGEDPLTFAAGDANFYRYVGNTPMTLTDPSGLCWEGIKSMATSTWNSVTSVANNIWNGVKSQVASVWNNASNYSNSSYLSTSNSSDFGSGSFSSSSFTNTFSSSEEYVRNWAYSMPIPQDLFNDTSIYDLNSSMVPVGSFGASSLSNQGADSQGTELAGTLTGYTSNNYYDPNARYPVTLWKSTTGPGHEVVSLWGPDGNNHTIHLMPSKGKGKVGDKALYDTKALYSRNGYLSYQKSGDNFFVESEKPKAIKITAVSGLTALRLMKYWQSLDGKRSFYGFLYHDCRHFANDQFYHAILEERATNEE